jgi:hypothetical protein
MFLIYEGIKPREYLWETGGGFSRREASLAIKAHKTNSPIEVIKTFKTGKRHFKRSDKEYSHV